MNWPQWSHTVISFILSKSAIAIGNCQEDAFLRCFCLRSFISFCLLICAWFLAVLFVTYCQTGWAHGSMLCLMPLAKATIYIMLPLCRLSHLVQFGSVPKLNSVPYISIPRWPYWPGVRHCISICQSTAADTAQLSASWSLSQLFISFPVLPAPRPSKHVRDTRCQYNSWK